MLHPNDPFVVYQTQTKWLWDPCVDKPGRNIMGMDIYKIVGQMWKINPRYQWKTTTFEWKHTKGEPLFTKKGDV
jgi:acyl-homoserine lactone acylase PvdQ